MQVAETASELAKMAFISRPELDLRVAILANSAFCDPLSLPGLDFGRMAATLFHGDPLKNHP